MKVSLKIQQLLTHMLIETDQFMGKGKVISSAKHFLADGATENGVDQGDALISEKELATVHAAGLL